MAVILVVEDEEQTRVLVESIPVDDGHQALTAAATAQALAVLLSIAGGLCPDHRDRLTVAEIRMAFLTVEGRGPHSLRGVDHRHDARRRATFERRSFLGGALCRSRIQASMRLSACAWRRIVCNWQTKFIALLCSGIFFRWRGFGALTLNRARSRISRSTNDYHYSK
jgi:hypothetical protein